MSPDTARLLEAFQRICFTAAVAYLMNLRMVLFAYSLCALSWQCFRNNARRVRLTT